MTTRSTKNIIGIEMLVYVFGSDDVQVLISQSINQSINQRWLISAMPAGKTKSTKYANKSN